LGELIGIIVGSLLWTWLFGWALRKAGIRRVTAYLWGYLAMMTAAIVISQFTGFSQLNLLLYGACGLIWTIWFAREPRSAVAKRSARSADQKRDRRGHRLRDSDDHLTIQRAPDRHVTTTTCRACSRDNEMDADYCVACGRYLAPKSCPKCNTENAPDATYCKRCGNLVGKSSEPTKLSASNKSADDPDQRQPGRAEFKCFDCGTAVRFGAESCRECGLEFVYSGDIVTRAQ
jgi:ribosomal protein L40E